MNPGQKLQPDENRRAARMPAGARRRLRTPGRLRTARGVDRRATRAGRLQRIIPGAGVRRPPRARSFLGETLRRRPGLIVMTSAGGDKRKPRVVHAVNRIIEKIGAD